MLAKFSHLSILTPVLYAQRTLSLIWLGPLNICFCSLKKTKKQRDVIQYGDEPLRRPKLLEIETQKRIVCIVGPLICPICLIELYWYRFGQFSMSFLSNKSSFLPISSNFPPLSHPLPAPSTRPLSLLPHFPPPLSPYPPPPPPPVHPLKVQIVY